METEHPNIDDSYIEVDDKKNLLKTIKAGYDKTFPWADENLTEILIKDFYRQVVTNMDRDKYLEEKSRQHAGNVDDLIELIGKSTVSSSWSS